MERERRIAFAESSQIERQSIAFWLFVWSCWIWGFCVDFRRESCLKIEIRFDISEMISVSRIRNIHSNTC